MELEYYRRTTCMVLIGRDALARFTAAGFVSHLKLTRRRSQPGKSKTIARLRPPRRNPVILALAENRDTPWGRVRVAAKCPATAGKVWRAGACARFSSRQLPSPPAVRQAGLEEAPSQIAPHSSGTGRSDSLLTGPLLGTGGPGLSTNVPDREYSRCQEGQIPPKFPYGNISWLRDPL
jgi:hypothetical protein